MAQEALEGRLAGPVAPGPDHARRAHAPIGARSDDERKATQMGEEAARSNATR